MITYVYLVCTAHSGSTLLAFLLGEQPQVATVGELGGRTDYEGYECSCGKPIIECGFWNGIKSTMQSKGHHVDLRNFNIFTDHHSKHRRFDRIFDHYFKYGWQNLIRDVLFTLDKGRCRCISDSVDRNIAFATTICEYLDKDVFFDSTKDLYRVRYLAQRLGDRFKLVYMTRDGRAVMNSLIKQENASDLQSAKGWLWSNSTIQRLIRLYCSDEQVFKLRYEDICLNTKQTLKKLLRFIGKTEVDFNHNGVRDSNLHIIGNYMRKSFDGRVMLDEKWKTELTQKQIDLFEKIAGRLNRELGYS